ncbi:carbohydrate ABC transporter permease [Cohnella hashimotonis]|uniref:Carbohydrate ABC transporter permease n=1 Tax=Cohnella hashimotonis TaxID=2826895 RepID=A0ABT6TGS9_9BACL|nr:carbohydrate ABC transporter permease [Cohnella hashimotonis]MDI4645027.1 carbohydrate ABC transporter permease [Cohnella hashimotonis]
MNIRSFQDRVFDWVNYAFMLLLAIVMIFPFFYLFSVSFTTYEEFLRSQLLLWPRKWSIVAYEYIFSSHSFIRSLRVTVYITILGTLVNLFFTTTMAYGLSRKIYGQRFIMLAILFTMLFSAGMIPTYLVVKETGLLDSIWSLILPAAIAPFNLIIVRQFFMSLPQELSESALIDGASDLVIFRKIVLPLSKPILAAFGLFYAVGHWNNYFAGILYLNDQTKWPIQVILRQIVVQSDAMNALGVINPEMLANQPPPETVQMAAILISTLPILIVYPFLQKHFAKGVMIGSIKG